MRFACTRAPFLHLWQALVPQVREKGTQSASFETLNEVFFSYEGPSKVRREHLGTASDLRSVPRALKYGSRLHGTHDFLENVRLVQARVPLVMHRGRFS